MKVGSRCLSMRLKVRWVKRGNLLPNLNPPHLQAHDPELVWRSSVGDKWVWPQSETPRWCSWACSCASDGGISWWSIGVNLAGWSPTIYFLDSIWSFDPILDIILSFQPYTYPYFEAKNGFKVWVSIGLEGSKWCPKRVKKLHFGSKIGHFGRF